MSGWRRLAGAVWNTPDNPQIFGALDVDAAPLIALIERAREAGTRITPTHLVGRAIAHALRAVPDLNVQIHGGWARPRESIDIFFITALAGGHDLSGVKVTAVDRKPVTEVAAELARRAEGMRRGDDAEFVRTKSLTDRLPSWLLRPALRVSALLTQQLRLDLPRLGLPAEPFGSAMVTSVGMFGLPRGFAPLARMFDVPLLVLVGELTEQPVAIDGRVAVRRVLPITATIDHRYVDGWQISNLMKAFQQYLADPARFEPIATVRSQPSITSTRDSCGLL